MERTSLAQTLRELGFKSCLSVWMRGIECKKRGKLYKYILVYTEDLLCVLLNPLDLLNNLDQRHLLKPESIVIPKTYLGTDITEFRLPDKTREASLGNGIHQVRDRSYPKRKEVVRHQRQILENKSIQCTTVWILTRTRYITLL
jgi:hypothetical protein